MAEQTYAHLLQQVDQAEVVDLCSELIRFKSVNPPGNEREIAEYVARVMHDAGLETELVSHAPDRASVAGRLKGSGKVPGLLYTGHLDVVPLGEAPWSFDAFAGKVEGGRILGRGASDMKAGDAAMIVAAKMLAAAKVPLKGDLILGFTAGEETDFLGAHAIANGWHLGPVQGIFISEPTDNEVTVAEKGLMWLEIATHGKTAHISQIQHGRNAIMMMLPILTALDKMPVAYQENKLLGGYVRSINTIHAGLKTNTIPDHCVAQVDMRTVPGQDHDAILQQIQELIDDVGKSCGLPDFRASLKVIHNGPPLETASNDPMLVRFLDVVAEVTGKRPAVKGAGYGTDGKAFVPKLKAPYVICGPGNPTQNHQTDEWADVAKMVESVKIYLLTATRFLA